jgi:hypothetical protein
MTPSICIEQNWKYPLRLNIWLFCNNWMIFPLPKAEEILVVGIWDFMNLEIACFQDLLGCIGSKTILHHFVPLKMLFKNHFLMANGTTFCQKHARSNNQSTNINLQKYSWHINISALKGFIFHFYSSWSLLVKFLLIRSLTVYE